MGKREAPEGFVTQEDLMSFAASNNFRAATATRLWNLMLGRISQWLKAVGHEELDVRCLVNPDKKWEVLGHMTNGVAVL